MTKTVAALTLHPDGSATLRFMREDGTVALVYCKDRAHADALQVHLAAATRRRSSEAQPACRPPARCAPASTAS